MVLQALLEKEDSMVQMVPQEHLEMMAPLE